MAYVDPAHKWLAHLDRVAAWQVGKHPAPVTVEWDLSNRCSLGCQFCHFAYTHTRGPLAGKRPKPEGAIDGGDLADVRLVRRTLSEMSALGVKAVVWTGGGEPTLHPFFAAVVEHAWAAGLEQGLYTHGGHIAPALAEQLKTSLKWVVVSLDAADAADYVARKNVSEEWFGRAGEGVKRLACAPGKAKIGASYLLDKDNWRDAERMMKHGLSLGADYVTFRPIVEYDINDPTKAIGDRSWISEFIAQSPVIDEWGGERDEIEFLPERFIAYRDWKRSYPVCYGIGLHSTITPNGKVWTCPNTREFPGYELGDLRTETFEAIWDRHTGERADLSKCRVLCRLHMLNESLWEARRPREHANFL